MKASFEKATSVIRQLSEGNAKLRAERDLLRAKIVRSAEQQEQTTALLKRTGVIVEKLMDENDMLHNERQGWGRNPWMFSSSVLRTRKISSPLSAETSSRGLQQCIKKVDISEPDRCLPSSFAIVYFGHCHMWLFSIIFRNM